MNWRSVPSVFSENVATQPKQATIDNLANARGDKFGSDLFCFYTGEM